MIGSPRGPGGPDHRSPVTSKTRGKGEHPASGQKFQSCNPFRPRPLSFSCHPHQEISCPHPFRAIRRFLKPTTVSAAQRRWSTLKMPITIKARSASASEDHAAVPRHAARRRAVHSRITAFGPLQFRAGRRQKAPRPALYHAGRPAANGGRHLPPMKSKSRRQGNYIACAMISSATARHQKLAN